MNIKLFVLMVFLPSVLTQCTRTITRYFLPYWPIVCTFQNISEVQNYFLTSDYRDKIIAKLQMELPTLDENLLDVPWNLSGLICTNCSMEEIKDKTFDKLPSLAIIILDQNNLVKLTNLTFGNLQNLTQLNLSQNALTSLEVGTFHNLPSLSKLDLSSNKLTELSSDSFDKNSNLMYLYLQNNLITSIENALFGHLNKLTILNLSYNKLTQLLPGSLSGLNSLNTLMLKGNDITHINEVYFHNTPRLFHLDISENDLEQLDATALIGNTRLGNIDFHSNLFSCKELFQLMKTFATSRVIVLNGPEKDTVSLNGFTCPGLEDYFDTKKQEKSDLEIQNGKLDQINLHLKDIVGLFITALVLNLLLIFGICLKQFSFTDVVLRMRARENTNEMQRMI